jgi:hypothetical protein
VTDHFSRRILACHGLRSVKTEGAKPLFRSLFREAGLPDAIRASDNGAPFASTGIHGLAALNVWWMQLGIVHQRITPASPHENALTSACIASSNARPRVPPREPAGATAPVRRVLSALQRRTPARGDRRPDPELALVPSPRPYPEHRTYPDYPAHMEIRRVSTAGTFRSLARQPFLSHALGGEDIGLEEVGDGICNSVYYNTLLGKIDERTACITGIRPARKV